MDIVVAIITLAAAIGAGAMIGSRQGPAKGAIAAGVVIVVGIAGYVVLTT
jgi:hypothetical protein